MGQLQRLEANVAGCRDAAWATGEGMGDTRACPCHPPHTLIHSFPSSHIDTPQQGAPTPHRPRNFCSCRRHACHPSLA
jgi:hypothetical protein